MGPALQTDTVGCGSRRPTRHALAAAGASVLLLLAACGGGGVNEPDLAAHAPAPLGEPSSESVKPPTSAPPTHVSQSDELALVKRQLQDLSAEVADLRRRIDRGAGGPSTGLPAPVEANDIQRAAASDAVFQAEPTDPAWSRRAIAAVRDAFGGQAAGGAQISQIECRSKSCRVEVWSADADAVANTLPAVLDALVALLPNATAVQVDRGNGHPSTLLYLSR